MFPVELLCGFEPAMVTADCFTSFASNVSSETVQRPMSDILTTKLPGVEPFSVDTNIPLPRRTTFDLLGVQSLRRKVPGGTSIPPPPAGSAAIVALNAAVESWCPVGSAPKSTTLRNAGVAIAGPPSSNFGAGFEQLADGHEIVSPLAQTG